MNPLRPVARLAALVLVCACAARAARAQGTSIPVKTSEKLEAILMLDALADGDDPAKSEYPKLKELIRPALDSDPQAKSGFDAWKGEGIHLCTLLVDVGGETLDGLVGAFAKPDEACALAEKGLDDPACRPTLDKLKKDSAHLLAFLNFLQKMPWGNFYQNQLADMLVKGRLQCMEALQKVDEAKLRAALAPYAGAIDPAPIEVWLTNFSGSASYRLRGNRIGLSYVLAPSAPLSLCREFCRRFVPTEATLASLKTLAEKDEFYGRAAKRIHGDLKEPAGEDFLEAAWLQTLTTLGLLTRKGALRNLKFSHSIPPGMPPESAGAPVAGIVFGELSAAPPGAGFAYDAFLQKLFADGKLAAGTVQAKYEEAIAEVLGIAGISTELTKDGRLMIAKVIPGLPAEAGGMLVGDELIKVDDFAILPPIDLNVVMDHLAGRRGDERTLGVRRLDKTVDVKFKLK